MLRNYLKIAWRNLIANRIFSLLNAAGLMLGMTVFLLINLYVDHERSYDQFHAQGDQIYRVAFTSYSQGGEELFRSATTFPRVGKELPDELAAVGEAARLYMVYGGAVVRHETRTMREDRIFVADQAFIDMFSYPWVAGDRATALQGPGKAVISAELASRLFPGANPLGKPISIANGFDLEVSGVMESVKNSHLRFDVLISYPTGKNVYGENFDTSWGWYDFYTYILLRDGASPEAVEDQFPAFIRKYANNPMADETTRFTLQPLEDIYLTSDLIQEAEVNGSARITNFLFILSFAILLIAWINYSNLATARAINRSREVGIRKSAGALPGQLIFQFLMEALILNLLAAALSLLLADLLLPWFRYLSGSALTLRLFVAGEFWIYAILALIAGSILSGFYPAFILTRHKPAQVLKGQHSQVASGQHLRKALVVFQFVASILLIAATLIINQQLNYMRNQELGIDIRQKLALHGPQVVDDSLYMSAYESFRNEITTLAGIEAVTAVSEVPGNLIYWTSGMRRFDNPEVNTQLYMIGVDDQYVEIFDHQLLHGRFFSEEFAEDDHLIFNRKAARDLGYSSPEKAIGSRVILGSDTLQVIGIMEDYHHQSLKEGITPVGLRYVPETRSYYVLDIAGNFSEMLPTLEVIFNQYFEENPFSYFLLDQHFQQQYESQERLGMVVLFFSIITILIASLGLIGLTLFSAYQRSREIGVRKVLGASRFNILAQLSGEYIRLILLAMLISWPLTWWLVNRWLENFAYHINVGWFNLILAGGITVFIALLAVIGLAWKAASQNPVNSIRTE